MIYRRLDTPWNRNFWGVATEADKIILARYPEPLPQLCLVCERDVNFLEDCAAEPQVCGRCGTWLCPVCSCPCAGEEGK